MDNLKDAYNQYCKLYRDQHKDAIKQSYKKWYEANKDNEDYKRKIKEYSKQYYQKKTADKPKRESKLTDEQKAKKKEYNKRYQEKLKQNKILII